MEWHHIEFFLVVQIIRTEFNKKTEPCYSYQNLVLLISFELDTCPVKLRNVTTKTHS